MSRRSREPAITCHSRTPRVEVIHYAKRLPSLLRRQDNREVNRLASLAEAQRFLSPISGQELPIKTFPPQERS